jgi:hypothetical protein
LIWTDHEDGTEITFEAFLAENKLTFQKVQEGGQRKPDYLVNIGESKLVFEVKELSEDDNFEVQQGALPVSSRTIGDHIRRKIAEARKQIQFGADQGIPSVLLIYNNIDREHFTSRKASALSGWRESPSEPAATHRSTDNRCAGRPPFRTILAEGGIVPSSASASPAGAAEPSPVRQCRESDDQRDESRQGRQNSRHPVARQDFRQFLAESTLLMVFLLVKNVVHRGIGLRNAHAEGGISVLPLERPAGLFRLPPLIRSLTTSTTFRTGRRPQSASANAPSYRPVSRHYRPVTSRDKPLIPIGHQREKGGQTV